MSGSWVLQPYVSRRLGTKKVDDNATPLEKDAGDLAHESKEISSVEEDEVEGKKSYEHTIALSIREKLTKKRKVANTHGDRQVVLPEEESPSVRAQPQDPTLVLVRHRRQKKMDETIASGEEKKASIFEKTPRVRRNVPVVLTTKVGDGVDAMAFQQSQLEHQRRLISRAKGKDWRRDKARHRSKAQT